MLFKDLNLLAVGNTIQMAGAIYHDGREDLTYLVFFPDEAPEWAASPQEDVAQVAASGSIELLHMNTENWKVFIRQTDLLETEILTRAKDGSTTKAIIRKSQRQIDQVVAWNVFRRDNYRCRYCGRHDVPLTVDHLVRWEEGGPSIEENLLSSCKKDNRIRGDDSYATWLQHGHYKKVSQNLTPEVRAANEAILGTLDKIPRQVHIKSR